MWWNWRHPLLEPMWISSPKKNITPLGSKIIANSNATIGAAPFLAPTQTILLQTLLEDEYHRVDEGTTWGLPAIQGRCSMVLLYFCPIMCWRFNCMGLIDNKGRQLSIYTLVDVSVYSTSGRKQQHRGLAPKNVKPSWENTLWLDGKK